MNKPLMHLLQKTGSGIADRQRESATAAGEKSKAELAAVAAVAAAVVAAAASAGGNLHTPAGPRR